MTAKLFLALALVAFAFAVYAQTNHPSSDRQDFSAPASGSVPRSDSLINPRVLFLKNCAHCHGATAHGDDGPDLHDLGLTDNSIMRRINQGKAGEMTAFAGKLTAAQISALVAYVQSLK